MQETQDSGACTKYELPAQNLESLCSFFTGIQKALLQGNTQAARALCNAGQQQLRNVVICFD